MSGLQLGDDSLFAFKFQLQSDLTSWDILLLQEVIASSCEQRLIFKGGHILFIASCSTGAALMASCCTRDGRLASKSSRRVPTSPAGLTWASSIVYVVSSIWFVFTLRICPIMGTMMTHTYQLALATLSSSLGLGQGVNRFHVIGMDANSVIGPVEQHGDVDHENALRDCSLVCPWGVGRRCRRGVVLLECARSAGMAFAKILFYCTRGAPTVARTCNGFRSLGRRLTT